MSERAGLPGPERAAAAAAHVTPALRRDLAAQGLHWGDPVFLRAFKEERRLEVFVRQRATGRFERFRTYPILAASGAPGPKLAEGDQQVPEGFYEVAWSAMKPDSRYHLAFNLGYPNAYDRLHRRTGSFLMIHGNRRSAGCLAMGDAAIEEIYTLCAAALEGGQPAFPVHVFPFRMTGTRLQQAADSPWLPFWRNLQQGYDFFEDHRIPPAVQLAEGSYQFLPPSPPVR